METKTQLVKVEREVSNLVRGLELTLTSGFKLSWSLTKLPWRLTVNLLRFVLYGPKLRRSVSPGTYEHVDHNIRAGNWGHFTHPPSNLI